MGAHAYRKETEGYGPYKFGDGDRASHGFL